MPFYIINKLPENPLQYETPNNETFEIIQMRALFVILLQHSKLQMLILQPWQVKDLENSARFMCLQKLEQSYHPGIPYVNRS